MPAFSNIGDMQQYYKHSLNLEVAKISNLQVNSLWILLVEKTLREYSLEGHEFISCFYCQVLPSLNKGFVVVVVVVASFLSYMQAILFLVL